MNTLLACHDLSFSYKDGPVLNQVAFAIAPGDTVAVVGPNGVGKTTLLKMCAGLLAPERGEIFFDRKPLAHYGRRELARRIALVAQELHLSFDFSVEELVSQGRTPYLSFLRGLQAGDRLEIHRALEMAGASHLADRNFHQLSGGERQRVKIALALAQNPELLLLDEPAQHLDIGSQEEVFALLLKLKKTGLTIMAAVHDLEAARRRFTSAILLLPDRRCLFGNPEVVLTRESIQAAFGVDYQPCECGRRNMSGQEEDAATETRN